MVLTERQVMNNIIGLLNGTDTATLNKAWEELHWYDEVNQWCNDESIVTGVHRIKVYGVVAAYSQNSQWKANKTIASRALRGDIRGMRGVLKKVNDILALPDTLSDAEMADAVALILNGPKISRFFWNILNPRSNKVTVDRWILRAALLDDDVKLKAPNASFYRVIERAIKGLARMLKVSCAGLQAVIWTIVRGSAQ